MVPMPVRVKPPPAEIGEIISPGWAALLTTTPLNGARITVLSRATSATWTRLARHLDLLFVGGEPGPQRVALGDGGVQRLGGDQLAPEELDLPGVVALGLLEQRADLAALRAGGRELGPRQRQLGLRLGVVQAGEDGALGHSLALLDQHLGDLAGDLRGHRGLPSRGDVAAGVEDGAGAGTAAARAATVRTVGGPSRVQASHPAAASAATTATATNSRPPWPRGGRRSRSM